MADIWNSYEMKSLAVNLTSDLSVFSCSQSWLVLNQPAGDRCTHRSIGTLVSLLFKTVVTMRGTWECREQFTDGGLFYFHGVEWHEENGKRLLG
jgi:hypothetical protein